MSKNYKIETPPDIIATNNYYFIQGKKYIRVTKILSVIDKPELHSWYANTGNVKAKKILKESAFFGSTIHKLIEILLIQNEIDMNGYEEKYKQTLKTFIEWKKKQNMEIEYVEQKLWSEKYGFAGTCDCIAIINGKRMICDWKTSKDIYPEYILQLGAYYEAFFELTNIELDGAVILQIRDGVYQEKYYTKKELQEAFKIFLSAKEIFEWRYKNEMV